MTAFTQNVALRALLVPPRGALRTGMPTIDRVERAERRARLPGVFGNAPPAGASPSACGYREVPRTRGHMSPSSGCRGRHRQRRGTGRGGRNGGLPRVRRGVSGRGRLLADAAHSGELSGARPAAGGACSGAPTVAFRHPGAFRLPNTHFHRAAANHREVATSCGHRLRRNVLLSAVTCYTFGQTRDPRTAGFRL